MYIVLIIVSIFFGAYFIWRKLQDKRVNKLNWDIQNKIVSLTNGMKVSSELSSAEFDVWAELNDLIVEKVTEYYNGSSDSQIDRYENSKKFLTLVEEQLKVIEGGNSPEEDLLSYTQKIKLTKLSSCGEIRSLGMNKHYSEIDLYLPNG